MDKKLVALVIIQQNYDFEEGKICIKGIEGIGSGL